MKKTVLVMVAALFAVGLFLSSNVVKAQDKGPAEIILKTAKARKPVKFPHHEHQARMKCDECHKNANFAKSANEWTKEQGHALCRDCHKKNNGPTGCTKCHIKKQRRKLEGC